MNKKIIRNLVFLSLAGLLVPGVFAEPASMGSFENYFNGAGTAEDNSGFYRGSDNYQNLLQGAWLGTNGRDTMKLILMNNMVGLELNGQQVFGTFSVNGNQLVMNFNNGKSVTYSFNLNNNVLILDNSVRLERQNMQMPNGNGGSTPAASNPTGSNVPSSGGAPGGGTWGGGQNSSQQNGGWIGPDTGNQSGGWIGPDTGNQTGGNNINTSTVPHGGNILQGTWFCQTPQGVIAFTFTDNSYTCFVNNQQTETGNYQYDPSSGNFNYQITSGQSSGVSGTNRIFVQNNIMTLVMPNGMQMMFQKQM